MHRFCCLFLLFLHTVMVFADHIDSAMQWPGWTIETSEEVGSTRYPITNMCDGQAATAWVFSKKKLHEAEAGISAEKPAATHGVGVTIRVNRTAGDPVWMDGIGLINGYGKDRPTYLRNNRIQAVEITLRGRTGNPWTAQFTLDNTRDLQHIEVPRRQVRAITLTIKHVITGPDDDLCISELALYDGKQQVPWRVTPVVVYNNSNYDCGCGGGPEFTLRYATGRPVCAAEKEMIFLAVAQQPGTHRVLLCTENEIFLFDLTRNQVAYRRKASGALASWGVGWVDSHAAMICFNPKRGDYQHKLWYRLTTGKTILLRRTTTPKTDPHFLPGSRGPYYPA